MKNSSCVSCVIKDHLGSITTITDASGTIQQELSYDAWGNLRNPITWSGSFTDTPLFDRGFTGHEHLYGFGLINMNGRMYDPVMSSFLSVDSYVQDPENSQNFNRYAYCFNNPLKYTDPTGEVVVIDDIVAAAIVGAIINGVVQTASGHVSNFGDWCLATVIGGASGAAGAWAGGAAIGLGFWSGAASGAIGGTAGGFISGAGNTWLNGGDFGDCMLNGFIEAGESALFGATIGGLKQGFYAKNHHGSFWTGEGSVFFQVSSNPGSEQVSIGDGMRYDEKYVEQFREECYSQKALKNIKKTVCNTYVSMNQIPKDKKGVELFEVRGDLMIEKSTGNTIDGACVYYKNRKSNVYLYKTAFTSKEQLFLTMSHEYIHAGFGFYRTIGDDYQHAVIYKWQENQAALWNMDTSHWASHAQSFEQFYSKSLYNYIIDDLGFNHFNYKPWF